MTLPPYEPSAYRRVRTETATVSDVCLGPPSTRAESLFECPRCFAVVTDTPAHDRWHAVVQQDAAGIARRATREPIS